MHRIQLIGGVLVLALAGCGINRAGLDRDVRALFDQCNVRPKAVEVTMSNRSRTGFVECSVTSNEVAAIVGELGLQEARDDRDDPDLRRWLEDGTALFDHPLLGPQDGIQVFRSPRRPKALRLPNGSSFEYMLLYWDRMAGTVLIQLSYASG